MAIHGYLKIPDIPGESVRDGHRDEIEVHGLEFGMNVPHGRPDGPRRGRVEIGTIVITKFYDRASPYLKRALVDNRSLREGVLAVVRTVDGQTEDYLVVTLAEVGVTTYALHPAPDREDLLEERVGLAGRRITFKYQGAHEVELTTGPGR